MSRARRLSVGEVVLFDDTPHRVERVTQCSATLVPQYTEPKEIHVVDRHGNERTFMARGGGRAIQVSCCAFMERVS